MDPLTVLGLASNVVQFVDYTSKLISGAYEVYSSITGMTGENADVEMVIQDLKVVTTRLSTHSSKPRTDDEIALSELASKCRQLSGDLVEVLNKLKSKNPHSKWESVQVIWASIRKKEKVASIEKRVNNYRSEILFRISIMMSGEQSNVRVQLEKIAQNNENYATQTRDELKALKRDILQVVEQLRETRHQGNTQTSLGYPIESLKDIHIVLSSMAEVTNTIAKEDWILEKLRFNFMYLREDGIEDAHTKTFEWLLYEPGDDLKQGHDSESAQVSKSQTRHLIDSQNEATERGLRQHARTSFLEWLRLGRGIFYISGKAGSGKSTLMKFLCQHTRTRDELNLWAANKKLVFAHFFFWNSGMDLQKSLEGLYRSILFETLRECPELIQDIFPKLWKAANNSRELGSKDIPIRFTEILAAFEVLTAGNQSFLGHKFCFFIDGLDEYEGDHWKIAKSLKNWTASLDIKICVSSRPHNEFEDNFSPDPKLRLRLHEITKEDMERFVRDEFDSDERFLRVKEKDNRYLALVTNIVQLADGVFLWVRLATSSLLTGLGNDFSILELEEKLEVIPTGLSALFRKMWDSIEHSDRVRSARTLLLATLPRTPSNMLVYSFLDDLDEDPHFTDKLYDGRVCALTDKEILERLERMRRRLNGRCKGLLEITETDGSYLFFKYQVGFHHRTVREFLVQDEMQEQLKIRARNFDALGSLWKTDLAQIKFCPTRELYFRRLDPLYRLVYMLIMEVMEKDSNPQIRLLEALYDLLDGHRELLSSHPQETAENTGQILWVLRFFGKDDPLMYYRRSGQQVVDYSLIHHAAFQGAFGFVSHKVSMSSSLLKPTNNLSLLVSASLGAHNSGSLGIKLTKFLLEHGASPNEQPPGWEFITRASPKSLIWTPWTLFLFGSIGRSIRPSNIHLSELLELLELFLRNDADASVCVIGYQESVEDGETLGGPFYITLEQLIGFWAPGNAETIGQLLQRKLPKGSKSWSNWIENTISFWKKQQPSIPKCQIKRFEVDEDQDINFSVLCVASMTSLGQLDISEIRRARPELLDIRLA